MGDLYNQYNSQIQVTLESIKDKVKLCKDNPNCLAANIGVYLKELDNLLASSEQTLMQMELEARSYSDTSGFERLEQVKEIRNFLKEASDCSRSFHTELQRRELLGEVSSFGNTREFKTFSKNREMLSKGLMFIKTSCDVANEAERLGYDASKNLTQQRNVIDNVSSELTRAKFSLSGADEYLCCLLKQGRLNRVILKVVQIGIGVTILIILTIRLIKFLMLKPK